MTFCEFTNKTKTNETEVVQEENSLISDHYEIHMVIIYITPDIALYKKKCNKTPSHTSWENSQDKKRGWIVHCET